MGCNFSAKRIVGSALPSVVLIYTEANEAKTVLHTYAGALCMFATLVVVDDIATFGTGSIWRRQYFYFFSCIPIDDDELMVHGAFSDQLSHLATNIVSTRLPGSSPRLEAVETERGTFAFAALNFSSGKTEVGSFFIAVGAIFSVLFNPAFAFLL